MPKPAVDHVNRVQHTSYNNERADGPTGATEDPTWGLLWHLWGCFGPFCLFKTLRGQEPGFGRTVGYVAYISLGGGTFIESSLLVVSSPSNGPNAPLDPTSAPRPPLWPGCAGVRLEPRGHGRVRGQKVTKIIVSNFPCNSKKRDTIIKNGAMLADFGRRSPL